MARYQSVFAKKKQSSHENSLSKIYNYNDFSINNVNFLVDIIVSWAGEVSLWEQ